MIVCCCKGITDQQARRAIRRGAVDADEVVRRTGAGSSCGGCRPTIEALIAYDAARRGRAPRAGTVR